MQRSGQLPGTASAGILSRRGVGLATSREELALPAAMKADFQFRVKRKIESGDTALVHNEWTVRGPKPQSGYAIEVFRRRAGMWRFLIGDPYTIGDLQTTDEASRMAEITAG